MSNSFIRVVFVKYIRTPFVEVHHYEKGSDAFEELKGSNFIMSFEIDSAEIQLNMKLVHPNELKLLLLTKPDKEDSPSKPPLEQNPPTSVVAAVFISQISRDFISEVVSEYGNLPMNNTTLTLLSEKLREDLYSKIVSCGDGAYHSLYEGLDGAYKLTESFKGNKSE